MRFSGRETNCSVFSLLEKACIQLDQVSKDINQEMANTLNQTFYRGFVYSRIFWSESLKLKE